MSTANDEHTGGGFQSTPEVQVVKHSIGVEVSGTIIGLVGRSVITGLFGKFAVPENGVIEEVTDEDVIKFMSGKSREGYADVVAGVGAADVVRTAVLEVVKNDELFKLVGSMGGVPGTVEQKDIDRVGAVLARAIYVREIAIRKQQLYDSEYVPRDVADRMVELMRMGVGLELPCHDGDSDLKAVGVCYAVCNGWVDVWLEGSGLYVEHFKLADWNKGSEYYRRCSSKKGMAGLFRLGFLYRAAMRALKDTVGEGPLLGMRFRGKESIESLEGLSVHPAKLLAVVRRVGQDAVRFEPTDVLITVSAGDIGKVRTAVVELGRGIPQLSSLDHMIPDKRGLYLVVPGSFGTSEVLTDEQAGLLVWLLRRVHAMVLVVPGGSLDGLVAHVRMEVSAAAVETDVNAKVARVFRRWFTRRVHCSEVFRSNIKGFVGMEASVVFVPDDACVEQARKGLGKHGVKDVAVHPLEDLHAAASQGSILYIIPRGVFGVKKAYSGAQAELLVRVLMLPCNVTVLAPDAIGTSLVQQWCMPHGYTDAEMHHASAQLLDAVNFG